jgi:hypothetical protein
MDAYTRPYGDAVLSAFPKMGEHPLEGSIVNMSGQRSPYTNPVARPVQGDAIAVGGTAVRGVGSNATGEHSGPCFAPQTTIAFPNSPESSQTGRALVTVPSKAGSSDFWDNRAYAGKTIA